MLAAAVLALPATALAQVPTPSPTPAPSAPAAQTPSSTQVDAANQEAAIQAPTQPAAPPSAGSAGGAGPEVVVTGSILRRNLASTDAPITVTTAQDLAVKGITTVAQGVLQISANSAGSLPGNFTANGAFAAGAQAVSLRGLTSNSTLTLIDGLRTAFYPLADDATRNFVDLNSIPDVIVDRIETLKDGASATYGADAIAGVVNVITKKTFEGFTAKAEGGFSQEGGGGENNYQALIGHGNLARDGYNVYLGVEYQHDDNLFNRERGPLYNTADLSGQCGASLGVLNDDGSVAIPAGSRTCRTNGVRNGLQFDGSFQGIATSTVPIFRPFTQNADGTYTAAGDYQLFNPASANCGALRPVTVTPDQAAAGGAAGITAGPATFCQQDFTHDYSTISPDQKRFSVSFRGTKQINADTQAYFTASYYQNDVTSYAAPSAIRQQSTPGSLGLVYSTAGTPGIVLPVYVCAAGVDCNATNGVLNPNNPFAALGEVSSIRYNFGDIPAQNEQFSQVYRFAAGIQGKFNLFGDWRYSVDVTGAQSDLRNTSTGDIYIAGLLQAVNTGAYNFIDPTQNSQTVRNLIAPQLDQYSTSKLGMVQVNLSRDLFQLPGGPLQLGVGGSVRYESIYNPSANPDNNGATNRYFTVNPFGTIGSRNTRAGFFELDAPVVHQLDLNLSGRYDEYSTGQDNFSPKAGGRIRPFADWLPALDKITLRSTYSQGFRVPSFAESNSLPSTGFTTANVPAPYNTAFYTAHGNDGYGQGYSLGQTTQGTGGLKPERSENFTAGIVVDPIRNLSFSLDFYRIKKRDFITPNTSNLGAAVAAYYAGAPIPAGYSTIPGIPDPNFPNAQPTLGFISYGFTNLGTETSSGYDIGATARFNLPYGVRYTSVFDGNYVLRLNLDPMNGSPVQHYAGTIGPYNAVAAGGTPKFRANWQNTLAYGPASFTVTAYYTDGYQLQAEDNGDTTGLCIADGATASAVNTTYLDGVTPVACKVKPFWDIDLHASYDFAEHYQVYFDMQNVFDRQAPYDPTTYGGDNYNATFGYQGILGRYFKVGLRATF